MSNESFGSFNVTYLQAFSCLNVILLNLLRSSSIYVINLHLISHEPRWGEWSLLHLSYLILGIQWISTDSSSSELYTVRLINSLQVVLRLVQAYVKSSRT
jgi:hypothetical protein